MTEPIEVRELTPVMRALLVLVCTGTAVGGYTLGFAAHQWPGYVMGGFALWLMIYALRAPTVLVRADDSGITYADMRYSLLLVFGEGRAAWSDVIAVDTRRRSTRSGSYLRTRVTVRGEGGAGDRKFTVNSRATGYMAFLAALHEHTATSGAVMGGLGDDPVVASNALSDMARKRMIVLAVVWIAMFLMAMAVFAKRH